MSGIDFIDCQAIIKAFEKGCAYSTDERSVFALVTPFLQDTMLMANTAERAVKKVTHKTVASIDREIRNNLSEITGKIREQQESMASYNDDMKDTAADFGIKVPDINSLVSSSGGVTSTQDPNSPVSNGIDISGRPGGSPAPASNSTVKSEPNSGFADALYAGYEAAIPSDKVREAIENCIPCMQRVLFEDIAQFDWVGKFEQMGGNIQASWKRYFEQVIAKFWEIIDMFRNWDDIIDVCAFINWLKTYVCIPDFYKILAALSMLLMDIAGILDGFGIDLILGLVFPLMLPSLQGLADILMQFLTLVLKPLECIIDSIVAMMKKFDLSSFKLPPINVRVPAGPRDASWQHGFGTDKSRTSSEKTMGLDLTFPDSATLNGTKANWNTKTENVFSFNMPSASNVDPAYSEKVNLIPKDIQQDMDAANKYMADITKQTQQLGQSLKSMFADLVGFIRLAIANVEKLLRDVIDEIIKLFDEYVLGYSVDFGRAMTQKLAILNMIKLISTIVKTIIDFEGCENPKETGKLDKDFNNNIVEKLIGDGAIVTREPNGDIRIEEPDDEVAPIRRLLSDMVKAQDPAFAGSLSDAPIFKMDDPVLNAKVAGIVEKLTSPVKVVFGCSYNVSSGDVDRYNQWLLGNG